MKSETKNDGALRRATCVAALSPILLLTSCGTNDAATPESTPSRSAQAAATEVSRIGAAGSACAMPVAFGLAASWKPKAVTVSPDHPLAELARRGSLTMVCEIDAKPAGSIGFLRVWTGTGDLRPALQSFIGAEAHEALFTDLRIGDRPALEVVYQEESTIDDSVDQERAFAVQTGQGIVAVSLESFDNAEHLSMLPAYELAKASLTVAG